MALLSVLVFISLHVWIGALFCWLVIVMAGYITMIAFDGAIDYIIAIPSHTSSGLGARLFGDPKAYLRELLVRWCCDVGNIKTPWFCFSD